MKISKNILKNISRKKYLEILPGMREKRTQAFTALTFTLIALSFFGFFAINPTLSTIAQLKRQLSDSQIVDKKLGEKIVNLGLLYQEYSLLEKDLPPVLAAVPKNPKASLLIGQLQSLAQESNLTIKKIQSLQFELVQPKDSSANYSSFDFSFEGEALSYNDVTNFLSSLINFDRLITIENLSITSAGEGGALKISLKGKTYFKN